MLAAEPSFCLLQPSNSQMLERYIEKYKKNRMDCTSVRRKRNKMKEYNQTKCAKKKGSEKKARENIMPSKELIYFYFMGKGFAKNVESFMGLRQAFPPAASSRAAPAAPSSLPLSPSSLPLSPVVRPSPEPTSC